MNTGNVGADTLHEADALGIEERRLVDHAEGALKRLRNAETVELWKDVGDACVVLRDAALRLIATNAKPNPVPRGKGYNIAWNKIVVGMPELKELDNHTRADSTWLAVNWEDVDAWRKTLSANDRGNLVHPTSIKRRFAADHKVEREGPSAADAALPQGKDKGPKQATPEQLLLQALKAMSAGDVGKVLLKQKRTYAAGVLEVLLMAELHARRGAGKPGNGEAQEAPIMDLVALEGPAPEEAAEPEAEPQAEPVEAERVPEAERVAMPKRKAAKGKAAKPARPVVKSNPARNHPGGRLPH
jgi:hypothetical protein